MGNTDNKLFTYLTIVFFLLFFGLLGYWVYVNFLAYNEDLAYVFTSVYCTIAFVGGTLGLKSAKYWGGSSSKIGKALLFLSFGLIFQFAFQISYSIYYFVLGIENPYPSVGDIFYVLGNLTFLLGIIKLYTVLFQQNTASYNVRLLGFLISVGLVITYITLYIKYVYSPEVFQIDSTKAIIVFLIDAITVTINTAMFYLIANSFVISLKYMGGILRGPVLILLTSVLLFYVADIGYTISDGLGNWKPAGIDDFLLFMAYTAVGIGIIKFKKAYDKLV